MVKYILETNLYFQKKYRLIFMKKINNEKNYNLSVIVPFYNEEKYLEESVLRLVEVNIYEKIILVNDNSKDKSIEIANMLCQKYEFIRLNL